jgi:hypothetical protein
LAFAALLPPGVPAGYAGQLDIGAASRREVRPVAAGHGVRAAQAGCLGAGRRLLPGPVLAESADGMMCAPFGRPPGKRPRLRQRADCQGQATIGSRDLHGSFDGH